MAETIPYAQLLMRLARVEVRINDIPIMLKETDGVTTVMRPIREFLLPGKNTAGFIIEPDDIALPKTPDGPVIRPDCAVRLRVAEIEDGEFMDFTVGEELFDIAIKPTEEDVPPVAGSGAFETMAKHRWAWSTASPIDPVSDRAAIDAFVAKASGMWAERDADGLVDLMSLSFSERAIAYPANPEENLKIDFRNELADTSYEWKPVPFDPDRAVYRSVAKGKLIEVLDTDGLPMVRTHTDDPSDPSMTDSYYPLPMMIGMHEGELKILL